MLVSVLVSMLVFCVCDVRACAGIRRWVHLRAGDGTAGNQDSSARAQTLTQDESGRQCNDRNDNASARMKTDGLAIQRVHTGHARNTNEGSERQQDAVW